MYLNTSSPLAMTMSPVSGVKRPLDSLENTPDKSIKILTLSDPRRKSPTNRRSPETYINSSKRFCRLSPRPGLCSSAKTRTK